LQTSTNLQVILGKIPVPPYSLFCTSAIYVGDFNSHHPDWGYDSPTKEGDTLLDWASCGDFALVHDSEQRGTFQSFQSIRWECEFSPDLCWVSSTGGCPVPAGYQVLEDLPHSQHRPCLVHVGVTPSNIQHRQEMLEFQEGEWARFTAVTAKSISTISRYSSRVDEAYSCFTRAISKQATPPFLGESVPCTCLVWTRNLRCY